MKKILIITLCVLSTVVGYTQYNLQFNKVLTYAGTLDFSTNNSNTWVVPSGKVWKIESMTTMSHFIVGTGSEIMYFNLNNIKIKKYFGNEAFITSKVVENPTPLWLKSGDTIQFTSNTNLAGTYNCNYFISIIEFNLAP